MIWWLWLLLGVIALVGESLTMALFLIYVGIAALLVSVLTLLGLGAALQVILFLLTSTALLGLVRPRTLHLLNKRVPVRALTNQGRIAQRAGVATETVSADTGMIRLGSGEFWTARVQPPTTYIAIGTPVRVVYVEGLTAYVEPIEVTVAS